MTYGTRSGQLPVPPPSVRTGEVYADEGTLILDPAYAAEPAPPSYGYPPPPPSSVRPPSASWTDLRGNWVVPAPPSSRTAAPSTSRSDRGVIAAMGIGGLAVLAAFAAALLAFADEAPGARGREHATHATHVAAAVAPPAVTSLPVAAALTTNVAPPSVEVVTAAPVVELGDDVVPTVSAPAPARVVVAAPKSAPPVVAAAPAAAPAKAAAAPAATPKKAASKASGKSQQEILEDLLEQQLAR